MNRTRLTVISVVALAFAIFETGAAYAQPDTENRAWAVFSWVCIVFVIGIWWETLRKK